MTQWYFVSPGSTQRMARVTFLFMRRIGDVIPRRDRATFKHTAFS